MPIQSSLTPQQIADAGAAAGMSGQHLQIMVAIARAESGGNRLAHNSNPPDDSYGLWQINMLGSMGPERRRLFGISSNSQLYDPVTNAKAAQSIYKQQGYKAWSVYNSGSYKKYLGASFQPSTGQSESMSPGEAPEITAGHQLAFDLFGIRKTFREFTETARKAAILWIVILLALVLLILGIILINKDKAVKLAKFAADVKS
jgi:Lysozyme like domain